MLHTPPPPATTSQNRAATNTTLNQATQAAWDRIFQVPFRFLEQPDQEVSRLNDPAPRSRLHVVDPANNLPPVDYAFVEPQAWPDTVVYIDRSVFSTTQPYPVPKKSRRIEDPCLCYRRCVAENHLLRSCVNVATCMICDDLNCSNDFNCGNRFEKTYPLDLIETRAGFSVVSSYPILEGAFIVEYVGDIVYACDAAAREDQRYQAQLRTKAGWNGGRTIFIDAFSCGNKSRFVNHSCRPNCALYEYDWTNTTRLDIFAIHDIPTLRELTFQYTTRKRRAFECRCIAH